MKKIIINVLGVNINVKLAHNIINANHALILVEKLKIIVNVNKEK